MAYPSPCVIDGIHSFKTNRKRSTSVCNSCHQSSQRYRAGRRGAKNGAVPPVPCPADSPTCIAHVTDGLSDSVVIDEIDIVVLHRQRFFHVYIQVKSESPSYVLDDDYTGRICATIYHEARAAGYVDLQSAYCWKREAYAYHEVGKTHS